MQSSSSALPKAIKEGEGAKVRGALWLKLSLIISISFAKVSKKQVKNTVSYGVSKEKNLRFLYWLPKKVQPAIALIDDLPGIFSHIR